MSMHKTPLTPLEEAGLRLHHLPIGKPSQLSDVFRLGIAYAQLSERCCRTCLYYQPHHRAGVMHCASLLKCTSGDRYEQTEFIQLWKE